MQGPCSGCPGSVPQEIGLQLLQAISQGCEGLRVNFSPALVKSREASLPMPDVSRNPSGITNGVMRCTGRDGFDLDQVLTRAAALTLTQAQAQVHCSPGTSSPSHKRSLRSSCFTTGNRTLHWEVVNYGTDMGARWSSSDGAHASSCRSSTWNGPDCLAQDASLTLGLICRYCRQCRQCQEK